MASARITLRIDFSDEQLRRALARSRLRLAVLGYLYTLMLIRAGVARKQLERHAYPGQPSTRTRPPVARCECTYWRATFNDGRDHIQTIRHLIISVHGLPGVGWYEITWWCPHHGINAYPNQDGVTIPRWP